MKREFKLMIVGIICLMVFVGLVSAASIDPILIPGADNTDKTCEVVMGPGGPVYIEIKQEPVKPGEYYVLDSLNSIWITVPSVLAGSENSFDFTSRALVRGVIVKDGVDGANFYDYRPAGVRADTNLTTPYNGAKGISNIKFCIEKGDWPPPPPPNVPEFPTLALPVGMLIGVVGMIHFIKSREN